MTLSVPIALALLGKFSCSLLLNELFYAVCFSLGEGCSHTAAVMFKIECAVRLGYTSTTSQPCSWNDTFCRKVNTLYEYLYNTFSIKFALNLQIEPSRIVDIHFSKPKCGKDLPCMANKLPRKKQKIVPVCDEEEDAFFAGLRKVMPSSTILSSVTVVEQSAPRSSVVQKLPAPLKSLQKASYAAMSEVELEEVCHDVFSTQLKITSEESVYLEESTRLQSLSPLWHQHREGRITSSLFKRVKNASIVNPPMSLVKTVMGEYKFDSTKVPALNWGITHEDIARKEYIALVLEDHVELECVESGLHVNPLFPHLGATPDGVVNCDCCGKGLLEIKCPYKHRNSHPHRVEDSAFFLVKGDNGEVHLSTEHEYYFQIQGQLAVCDLHYCDFVCWTLCGLHYERVLADHDHFEEVKPALDRFFVSVLLPRLLTGSMSGSTGVEQAAQAHIPDTYCWCNGKDEGKMVACDNDSCERQWFHFGCVGVSRKPRGKWFCSADCRRKEMLSNAS